MRRICVITPNRDAYSETFIRAHIERLPARVRVLYGGFFPRCIDDGEPLLPPPPPPPSLSRRLARAILSRTSERQERVIDENTALRRFFAENGIEAVLAEFGPTGTAVMEVCRQAGVPLIVHFHGADAYLHDGPVFKKYELARRYPALFEGAAAIIAVSHDMERHLEGLGAPRNKIHYNPYGVETSLFAGARPEESRPLFAAVGRFVDKKAPHLTLLAFEKVLEACPEARLIMAGDGPLLEACRQMTRVLKLDRAVEFLGAVSHPEVATVMRRARAFVQHSLRTGSGDSEGTPVAVCEAQAAGLPVVATRHGGIVDVVLHGKTGFLVEEGDIAGQAQYMLRLARDAELARRLGRAARERICAKFTMEKSVARLWRIIEETIQRYSRRMSGSGS